MLIELSKSGFNMFLSRFTFHPEMGLEGSLIGSISAFHFSQSQSGGLR